MTRKRLLRLAPLLTIVAGLVLGQWLARIALSAWLESTDPCHSGPAAVLAHTECDQGTVSQGAVIRAKFPVTNAGRRRLILVERAEGCCGQSAAPSEVVVAPGESKELEVEVDTAPWCGQLEHAVRYATNDPALPQFTLTVRAVVESLPSQ